MTGDTPDWSGDSRDAYDAPDYRRFVAGRVRAHRLAQAAAAHPAPVRLCTGHFAPPQTYAVWHLPCRPPTFGEQVVQIVWHEDGDVFGCRIVPDGTEGA